jgi:mRNA interferase YafQ
MPDRWALEYTAQFRRDYKRLQRQGKDLAKLIRVLDSLAAGETLPAKHKDHALAGRWQGCRDCHIEPDWVLIYRRDASRTVLLAIAMGTHSQLRLA